MALSNIALYSANRLFISFNNGTTHVSPNLLINAYNIIHPNYNNSLMAPLPEEENYDHISFATPESDFTSTRFEILLELLKQTTPYYSKIEEDKNKKI
tara:strand:- start:4799 stop:5092 length:294 start_codon:yes stop_codon:yes gene_type:complete